MNYLTRDILDFYKFDKEKNKKYLTKYFSNSNIVGMHEPNSTIIFDSVNVFDKANVVTVDDDNIYEINKHGFRGEIYENSDVIASGCSITFGIGVPEEGRWTNILSNQINKNIINLGVEGASVKNVCTNIIQYCMNNKMPKEIFCLFPDFFRSMVVIDKEFYKSGLSKRYWDQDDSLTLTFCNPKVSQYSKDRVHMEIKDKSNIEDSVSPHQLILDSVNFIYILESFCLTNGIKLYWTTWDNPSFRILKEMSKIKDFKLKNFSQSNPGYSPSECNLHDNSEFNDHPQWERGSDYSIINNKKTKDYSHPGIHYHNHIAILFDNLRKQKNYDKIDI